MKQSSGSHLCNNEGGSALVWMVYLGSLWDAWGQRSPSQSPWDRWRFSLFCVFLVSLHLLRRIVEVLALPRHDFFVGWVGSLSNFRHLGCYHYPSRSGLLTSIIFHALPGVGSPAAFWFFFVTFKISLFWEIFIEYLLSQVTLGILNLKGY